MTRYQNSSLFPLSISIFLITILLTQVTAFAQDRDQEVIKSQTQDARIQQLLDEQDRLEKSFGKRVVRINNTWAMKNEIIIKFKKYASRARRSTSLDEVQAETIRTFRNFRQLEVIRIPDNKNMQHALDEFNRLDIIEYAQPNYIIQLPEEELTPFDKTLAQPSTQAAPSANRYTPNDPYFSYQWAVDNSGQYGGTIDADIDAPEAWIIEKGSSDIVVAVIDTGVFYTHEDLKNQMWVNTAELNGSQGVDDDGNGFIDDIYGYDFANGDGDPIDDHYHGTHCAGIIAAEQDNNIGISGIAPGVKIMALKFLDYNGNGTTSNAINCIDYAVTMGADLTSNSWGGGAYLQSLADAFNQSNIPSVIAAGNQKNDNDFFPYYPANYDYTKIINVLATDDNDEIASFSSFGQYTVNIGAPGVSVISTILDDNYGNASGTSMATPYVSGVLALVMSHFPGETFEEYLGRVESNGDLKSSLTNYCSSGKRLNAYNALTVTNAPPTATNVSVSGQLSVGEILTVSYNYFDREGDAEGNSIIKWFKSSDQYGKARTLIQEGTANTYSPSNDDGGYYICAEVTPVASSGSTAGFTTNSKWLGPLESDVPIIRTLAFPTKSNDYISVFGETIVTSGTLLQKGLVYGTTPGVSLSDTVVTSDATSDSYSTVAKNLNANTTYYLKLFATNENGTTYGKEYSITTLPTGEDIHKFYPLLDDPQIYFGWETDANFNNLVVQAPWDDMGNGAVYLYHYDEVEDVWEFEDRITGINSFSGNIVINVIYTYGSFVGKDHLIINSAWYDKVEIYKRNSETKKWELVQDLSGLESNGAITDFSIEDNKFFAGVSKSYYKNFSDIGRFQEYTLNQSSGLWEKSNEITQGGGTLEEYFGGHIAINDNYIVVANLDHQGVSQGNSIFIYDRSNWNLLDTISEPILNDTSNFGVTINLSNNDIFIESKFYSDYYIYHYIINESTGETNFAETIQIPDASWRYNKNIDSENGFFAHSVNLNNPAPNLHKHYLYKEHESSNEYYVIHKITDDSLASNEYVESEVSLDSNFIFSSFAYTENDTWYNSVIAKKISSLNFYPGAVQINVSGSYSVGSTLTGTYLYVDNEGDPEGQSLYQWYRADDKLGNNFEAISGANSLTYTLQEADAGKYILLGVTPVSSGQAPSEEKRGPFSPVIASNLPIVTTLGVSSLGSSYASCSGLVTLQGGAAVTDHGFVYSINTDPTTEDSKISLGAGEGEFHALLTGLTPETDYYSRAYATNSNGTTYGESISFTTPSSSESDIQKLTLLNPEEYDMYGSSVAVCGNYMVVGAIRKDNVTSNDGSIYIYKNVGADQWQLNQIITSPNVKTNDYFGFSLSISENWLVVASWYSTKVYVYKLNSVNGLWEEHQQINAFDYTYYGFGYSVCVSGDFILVGSPWDSSINTEAGSAYIFKYNSSSGLWEHDSKLEASDADSYDYFGENVSIQGNYAIVGAYADNEGYYNTGAAYIFKNENGTWTQTCKLTDSQKSEQEYFGDSVSIYGDFAVVGAPYDDINKEDSGSIFIYKRDVSESWELVQKFSSDSSSNLGCSVFITDKYILAGADHHNYSRGAAFLYKFDQTSTYWAFAKVIEESNLKQYDYFGDCLAVSGETALIGAPQNNSGAPYSGSAYVFDLAGVNAPPYLLDVALSGEFSVGNTLTANYTYHDVENNPESVTTYQWYYAIDANGTNRQQIPGATSSTYTIEIEYSNNYIACGVTPAASEGTSPGEEVVSPYTAQITGDLAYVYTGNTRIIDSTFAECFGEVITSGSSPVTEIGIAYSTSDNPTINDYYIISGSGTGSFFAMLEGLTPSTIYYYRAVAKNGQGVSYGDTKSFMTLPSNSNLENKLELYDADPDDNSSQSFGISVATDGTLVAIGSYSDDSVIENGGAVYIYKKDGNGNWSLLQKLVPSNVRLNEYSGNLVFLSNQRLFIGSLSYQKLYIYKLNGSTNQFEFEQLIIKSGEGGFPSSISADGDELLIGSSSANSGQAYIYRFNSDTSQWLLEDTISASDGILFDYFGSSVSISGDYAIVGAPGKDDSGEDSGACYVFKHNSGSWSQISKHTDTNANAGDKFGTGVSIFDNYAVATAPYKNNGGIYDGSIFIYKLNSSSGEWELAQQILGDSHGLFGKIVCQTSNRIISTSPQYQNSIGRTLVFNLNTDTGEWSSEYNIVPFDGQYGDRFGYSSSIYQDLLVVGAPLSNNTGSVYIYSLSEVNSPPYVNNVAISGDKIVGNPHSVSFSYHDAENDPSGNNIIKWYRADDASGTNQTEISGESNLTYTPQVEDIGKYIAISVTPVALTGTSPGDEVFSSWFGPVTDGSPYYSISVSGSGAGSGSITSSPGGVNATWDGSTTSGTASASFIAPGPVTLTATPAQGSSFAGWSGDASGTDTSTSVTLDGNKNVVASFTLDVGSLTVTISPQEAIDAGAQWRRTGTSTWYDSGATESDVPIGSHTVEFSDVSGWTKPANQSVTISKDTTASASGTYTEDVGSLSVTISPQEAIDAGAQWRRTGTSTWYDSGATESDVPVGSHTIEFSDVSNWTKPANQSVTVSKDTTASASGTYTFSGLALSAASAECAAGEQTSIDISLSAGDGIEAFGFDLVFDSTKLTLITPVAKGSLVTESFTFDSNLVDANTLRIGGLDSGGGTLNAGAGTVAVVTFEVKEGLAEDTSIPLTITNLTDDILNAQPVSGQITVSECAINYDINGDGSVTPGDALIVFKHYLGIETITDPCQLQKADANGDDSITPGDALIVFKEYLGLN